MLWMGFSSGSSAGTGHRLSSHRGSRGVRFEFPLTLCYTLPKAIRESMSWGGMMMNREPFSNLKGKLPAYDPLTFSRDSRTWDEIAQAMCQSELVHKATLE